MHESIMAPKKMRELFLRIQRQKVKDPLPFQIWLQEETNVEFVCFDLFKTFFILKEIEESEGRQQIGFSQEMKEEVRIANNLCL
jgi:hypothetical protein